MRDSFYDKAEINKLSDSMFGQMVKDTLHKLHDEKESTWEDTADKKEQCGLWIFRDRKHFRLCRKAN